MAFSGKVQLSMKKTPSRGWHEIFYRGNDNHRVRPPRGNSGKKIRPLYAAAVGETAARPKAGRDRAARLGAIYTLRLLSHKRSDGATMTMRIISRSRRRGRAAEACPERRLAERRVPVAVGVLGPHDPLCRCSERFAQRYNASEYPLPLSYISTPSTTRSSRGLPA
jgi:hypothetical protein